MHDSLTTYRMNRVPYWLKIGLVVVGFAFFIASTSLYSSVYAQPINNFGVKFDVKPGLDHVCLEMDIRNNQLIDDSFPFKTILNDTSIDLSKAKITLWEYEYITRDVTVCDSCIVKDCWLGNVNGTQAGCNDITFKNCKVCGSHLGKESSWEWVKNGKVSENKDILKKEMFNSFSSVTINKTGSKRYRLCYEFDEIPVNPSTGEVGSFGTIAVDIKNNIYLDTTNSSWWNLSFPFRYEVLSNATTSNIVLNVNDTFIPNIWTQNVTGGFFAYCEISGCASGQVAIANATAELNYENASTRTGNNPLDVWQDGNTIVLHLDSKDGTLTYASTQYNNTGNLVNGAVINETNGVWGDSYYGDGTADREIQIPYDASWDIGIGRFTFMFWFWVSDTNNAQVLMDTRANPGEIGLLSSVTGDNIRFQAKGGSGTMPVTDIAFTATDEWTHVAMTRLNTNNNTFYVNGEIESSFLDIYGDISANDGFMVLGGRFDSGFGSELVGGIDEFSFFNFTLTETEIRERYKNGVNSLAPLGPRKTPEEVISNTSLLGINFTIPDFTFSSSTFVTLINVSFNTSLDSTYGLLSSMNIEKLTGGGTNVVSARILVDDIIILEEELRSVTGISDIGSSGTSPILFNRSVGEHSITYQFSRTGNGDIGISNIDLTLFDMVSSDNQIVRAEQVNLSYSHSSLSFTTAFNWTINKSTNSSTVIIAKQTVDKILAGDSVAAYKYLDVLNGDESPFWSRLISGNTDVGSLSSTFIQEDVEGSHGWSILSSQSNAGDTVNVNGTLIDFDMLDSLGNRILNFQTTNNQTNETQSLNLTAGTHLLATDDVFVQAGNQYFLSMSTTFSSLSGAQTPLYFINSTGNITCRSEKERSLSSNSDIGNAFIYFICTGLSINTSYTFNLYVTVAGGETLTQIDESLNGFESTSLDITIGNVAPIPNDITNPLDGTNVSGSDTITWLAFFDPNLDPVTYNVTLNNIDGSLNFTIGQTAGLSFPVEWNDFLDGDYLLVVTGFDPSNLFSNTTISITVVTIPPAPIINISFIFNVGDTLPVSNSFCSGNFLITEGERENCDETTGACTTLNQTHPLRCRFGCSNWTLSTFGNPGCEESDFWLAIAFIITLIVVVLIIRGAAK